MRKFNILPKQKELNQTRLPCKHSNSFRGTSVLTDQSLQGLQYFIPAGLSMLQLKEAGLQMLEGNQKTKGFENAIEGRGLVSRICEPNSKHSEFRLHAEGGTHSF
jgi:hypothetical protein